MNSADKQYLDIARDILGHGTRKQTRAGEVLSVFDRTMRYDLKDGLPLLTTKKVFIKGVIHELLWFLSGDTNIKYLVDNNVNIWTDDAYRYYNELVNKHNDIVNSVELERDFYKIESFGHPLTKEEFVEKVKNGEQTMFILNKKHYIMSSIPNSYCMKYTFGDLGKIYGAKWRGHNAKNRPEFGYSGVDQVEVIIDKLKNNPDDRRMICVAFDNDVLYSDYGAALPPCHVMWQVYTREVSHQERINWYNRTHSEEDTLKECEETTLDEMNVPKRELSLTWIQRSVDWCAGEPFNSASYGLLLYILAEITNMIPGELVGHFEDVHIYCNHIDGIKEQLTRTGSEILPQVKFAKKLTSIDDIKFEDIIITDYNPDAAIKFQLNVG